MVGAKGDLKNLTWRSFSNGWREGTGVVPRYKATSFMFRGNCFLVTTLIHNITTTWVKEKKIVANTED